MHANINIICQCINIAIFLHKRQFFCWWCISLCLSQTTYQWCHIYLYISLVNMKLCFTTYVRAFMPTNSSSSRRIKFVSAKLRITSSQLSKAYHSYISTFKKEILFRFPYNTMHVVALQKITNTNNYQHHHIQWAYVLWLTW
jgi:hypothetical protein